MCCLQKMFGACAVAIALFAATTGADELRPDDSQAVPELFEGTVMTVEANHLTVMNSDEVKRFLVPDNAAVLLNGRQSSLDDLSPGMLAMVMGQMNERPIAMMVDAVQPY